MALGFFKPSFAWGPDSKSDVVTAEHIYYRGTHDFFLDSPNTAGKIRCNESSA